MCVQHAVISVLKEALGLGEERSATLTRDTELLGALPELDSMSVMAVIAALEQRFGFSFEPSELDSASFATVGALTDLVEAKLKVAREPSREITRKQFVQAVVAALGTHCCEALT